MSGKIRCAQNATFHPRQLYPRWKRFERSAALRMKWSRSVRERKWRPTRTSPNMSLRAAFGKRLSIVEREPAPQSPRHEEPALPEGRASPESLAQTLLPSDAQGQEHVSPAASPAPSSSDSVLFAHHVPDDRFKVDRDGWLNINADLVDDVDDHGFCIRVARSLVNTAGNAFYWVGDVLREVWRVFLSCVCVFCAHPIRDVPGPLATFWLCFRRANSQVFHSQRQFLVDQVLHLICGLFISLAGQNLVCAPARYGSRHWKTYLGSQPNPICDVTPAALLFKCLLPDDHIREVGVFMSMGVLFAGISAATGTFGHERVVYWRETSAGMPTMP